MTSKITDDPNEAVAYLAKLEAESEWCAVFEILRRLGVRASSRVVMLRAVSQGLVVRPENHIMEVRDLLRDTGVGDGYQ